MTRQSGIGHLGSRLSAIEWQSTGHSSNWWFGTGQEGTG